MKNIFSRTISVQKYFNMNANVTGPRDGTEVLSSAQSLEATHDELVKAANRINEIRLKNNATDADIQELKKLEIEYDAAGKTAEQIIARAKSQAAEKHKAVDVAIASASLATSGEKYEATEARNADEKKLVSEVETKKAEVTKTVEAEGNKVVAVASSMAVTPETTPVAEPVKKPAENARTNIEENFNHKGVSNKQFLEWIKQWKETGDNNIGFKVVQTEFSDFNGKVSRLSEWGMKVEKTNKAFGKQHYPIGELQMYNIIERNQSLFADFLVRNGINANSSMDQIVAHRDTLFKKVNALSDIQQMVTESVGNVSVDIPTVLAGNEQAYIDSLLAKRENLLKIKDKMVDETDPKGFWARLGAKVKELGVVFPLPGAYLRGESHEIKFTELKEGSDASKALVEQVKGRGLQAVLGDGPVNITGKISLLAAIGQLNFNDDENKIIHQVNEYSKELQSMNRETFLASVATKYPELANSQLIQVFKENPNIPYVALVNTLVHNKLGELATKDAGWRLKGVEGILSFAGAGAGVAFQNIKTTFYETDGSVSKTVTKGIEQSADGLITVKRNPDHTLSYTFENTSNLQAQIRQIDPSAKFSVEGSKLVVVTTNLLNTKARVEVLSNGNERISYNIENAGNATTITEGVPASVQEEILSEAVEWRAMEAVKASGLERLDGRSPFAKLVYTQSRYHKDFATIVLPAIAKGDYAAAYEKMVYHKKSLAEIRNFVTVNGQPDPQKMLELLTYTYGSASKELNGKVRASTYESDRRKVMNVEKGVIKATLGVDITIDETPFLNKMHTATPAANMFPGQRIATSIVASPANSKKVAWDPVRRLDNFDAALTISNHTAEVTDIKLKKALLEKAHSARVDKEVDSINTQLRLDPKITREQYIDILTGQKKPEEVHKGLKFQEGKNAKFLEVRAMVEGNICNNLGYMIVFPLFEIPGQDRVIGKKVIEGKPGEVIEQNPVVTATIGSGQLGEKVQVTEVGAGVGQSNKVPQGPSDSTSSTPQTIGNPIGANNASVPAGRLSQMPTGSVTNNLGTQIPNISNGGSAVSGVF